MTGRHVIRRGGEAAFAVPAAFAGHSQGFARWAVVDESVPAAVHTGFGVCTLEPGGTVDAHVSSFEESVHLLDGALELATPDGVVLLRAGDYALVPIGVPHALRNRGDAVARWADMLAPQPRSRLGDDTWFTAPLPERPATPIDVRDPRVRSCGHIDPANMDPGQQTQDKLAVSASMRTALLVYSGITVKMMVDADLGAQLQTMFMVQYEPAGVAGTHDHPFEETYLVLEGEVDASFDGEVTRLGPGDAAWAGVGCVHGFANPAQVPVRWLETQAPQPPGRYSYRFTRDWDYLSGTLNEGGGPDG
jgi:quercetin dioxygenase-like cupin family protein